MTDLHSSILDIRPFLVKFSSFRAVLSTMEPNNRLVPPLRLVPPWGVLVLLICVQIFVRLDCISHNITMQVWKPARILQWFRTSISILKLIQWLNIFAGTYSNNYLTIFCLKWISEKRNFSIFVTNLCCKYLGMIYFSKNDKQWFK